MLSQRHHCRLRTKLMAKFIRSCLDFFWFQIKFEKQNSPEQSDKDSVTWHPLVTEPYVIKTNNNTLEFYCAKLSKYVPIILIFNLSLSYLKNFTI
jgi:hypothetical protein